MQLFSNEEGSASVLVIFMMIVLVTLGAYSIVSAHVNYSFSQKALAWNKNFYSCDLMAEEFLKDLDLALAKAEKEIGLYVSTKGYEKSGNGTVPEELRDEIRQRGLTKESMNLLYRHCAYGALEKLQEKYPSMAISDGLEEVTINFSLDEEKNANIRAKILIEPLIFNVTEKDGVVRATKSANAKRCRIEKWEQWQEVQEDQAQELWDGIPRGGM
ncbi:MAG: hypothetical protein LBC41_15425 [Clostridiales bacterium]|jgi:hypothetical protein|nr:hypothetical protein [Clostridiales bacterium]MDR2752045.1 hypothetical protein [Clostridiales bacterium]